MTARQCPHCAPYPGDRIHAPERLAVLIYDLLGPLVRTVRACVAWARPAERVPWFDAVLMHVLVTVRVLVPVAIDDGWIPNRTMVVVREARIRGIPIFVLALFGRRPTMHFMLRTQNGDRYFNTLPIPRRPKGGAGLSYDDKWAFKQFLIARGFPVAQGAVFSRASRAQTFAQRVGYPVVVKPRTGSLTKHTTIGILNARDLATAVTIARMVEPEFLVEEFIPGDVYRVTLVGGVVAAVCLREAPNVVGDGATALGELIAIKNADPRRGDFTNRTVTLHTITQSPNLDLGYVPKVGEKVVLHPKALMGAGGDVHDVTERMHLDNRVLCERLARDAGEALLGIDLITRDIARSYHDERLAILEANTVPYIDMHHYPVTGDVQNVASLLLDAYLTSV